MSVSNVCMCMCLCVKVCVCMCPCVDTASYDTDDVCCSVSVDVESFLVASELFALLCPLLSAAVSLDEWLLCGSLVPPGTTATMVNCNTVSYF